MGKSIKNAYRRITVLTDILLLLFFALSLSLQLTQVQTFFAQKASAYLSSELGNKVEISKLRIDFIQRVVISDLYVSDLDGDSLLYTSSLDIGFDPFQLFLLKPRVQSFCFHDPVVQIHKSRDSLMNYQFIADYFSNPNDTSKVEINIHLSHFEIYDGRVEFNNLLHDEKPEGFDPNHLNIKDLDIYASEVDLEDGQLQIELFDLSLREDEFQLEELSAGLMIDETGIDISDFLMKTPHSEIHGRITLITESWKDYNDFLNKVQFKTRFLPSDLAMADLSYFVPDLNGLADIPKFSGYLSGSISNLKGRDLNISLSNHSYARLNFKFKGLPHFEETFIYLDIKDLRSSKNGIERIKIPPFRQNKYIQLPPNFAEFGQIDFMGKIIGFPNNMNVNGILTTKIGELRTDVSLKIGEAFEYEGKIEAIDFDAGKFFDSEKALGKVSLVAEVSGKGLSKEDIDARIDGRIRQIELNKYNYKNIVIEGQFVKQLFEGSFVVNDPYLGLDFNGTIDLKQKQNRFQFNASIRHFYPRIVMGMKNVDSSAHINSDLKIDIVASNIDSLVGTLDVSHLLYCDWEDEIYAENFHFLSSRNGPEREIIVQSDIFDFNVQGRFDMLDGFKTFRTLVHTYIPNLVQDEVSIDKDFKFSLLIKDYSLVEKLASPGLFIGEESWAKGSFRSADNHLDISSEIHDLETGALHVDTLGIMLYSEEKSLNLESKISHYALGKNLKERYINLKLAASENEVTGSLSSHGQGPFSSEMGLVGYVHDKNTVEFGFRKAKLTVGDEVWKIPDSNRILYDSTTWNFRNLSVYHQNKSLSLEGSISHLQDELLKLTLKNFDLDIVNEFTDSTKVSMDGVINGDAQVRNLYGEALFESDLQFQDIIFNGKRLGTGHVLSKWDEVEKRLDVDGHLAVKEIDKLDIRGQYNTRNAASPLDFTVEMNELPLTVIEPLTENILSDINGTASGLLRITGSLKDVLLNGTLFLKDPSLKVDYTQVTYQLRSSRNPENIVAATINKDRILIPEFRAIDEFGNEGTASVDFIHEGLTKFDVDLKIKAKQLHVLNTNAKDNELFYGTAFATGDVQIWAERGYSKLKIDLETEDRTRFNLPIDESSDVDETKFIVFEKREEDTVVVEKKEEKKLNLELDMKLRATPGALVRIVFDEATGDVIETRGLGELQFYYDPENELQMFGEYEIVSGTYVFSLQTVVSKKFQIASGSRITWSGDPYAGDMNVLTNYRTKARLIDILPRIEQGVSYDRRIPVDVQLRLTESIEAPIVNFDIFLPESRELERAQLRTELSNESCLNQQVFSLLILGSFTPCESKEEEAASNVNVGKQTAYEAMSNQLSGWLSQISDQVDIGFSYQPEIEGAEPSPEQVEVALSTQLFNDRLILDGNVGYANNQQQTNTTENTRDWAGEFTVEYKIREDGRLRVKAFNKVNDRAYIENDDLYIQGVGLKYSKDFGSAYRRFETRRKRMKDRREE